MIPCLFPGWIRHCFCFRWGGDSHINRSLQYNVIKSVSYRRTYPICACQERLSRNWPELRGWQPIPHNCVLSIYMFSPSQVSLSSSLTSFPMNHSPSIWRLGQRTRFFSECKASSPSHCLRGNVFDEGQALAFFRNESGNLCEDFNLWACTY